VTGREDWFGTGAADGAGGNGHGPAAAEALRLLSAVQDLARDGVGEHAATGAEECRYCPVCRLIAILRGDRPEVTDRLAEAGTAFLAALRAALGPGSPAAAPAEPPPVQRIDLD